MGNHRVVRQKKPCPGWEKKLEIAEQLIKQGVSPTKAAAQVNLTLRTLERYQDLKRPSFQPRSASNSLWATTRKSESLWYKTS